MVFRDHVHTVLPDGSESLFWPPYRDSVFRMIAEKFGYTCALQYGIEHDITHSWTAMMQGLMYSEVVWADAHGGRRLHPAKVYDDEEHLVNRMLHYLNTGEPDRDYGVLEYRFGTMLPAMGAMLWGVLRGQKI